MRDYIVKIPCTVEDKQGQEGQGGPLVLCIRAETATAAHNWLVNTLAHYVVRNQMRVDALVKEGEVP